MQQASASTHYRVVFRSSQ